MSRSTRATVGWPGEIAPPAPTDPGVTVYTFEVLRDEADPAYPRGSLVSGPQDVVHIARHLIGADITEVVLASSSTRGSA